MTMNGCVGIFVMNGWLTSGGADRAVEALAKSRLRTFKGWGSSRCRRTMRTLRPRWHEFDQSADTVKCYRYYATRPDRAPTSSRFVSARDPIRFPGRRKQQITFQPDPLRGDFCFKDARERIAYGRTIGRRDADQEISE
jgi:hypothetical protein